ncbi:hypothetical protein FOA43_002391 [Brettanomyces nanus]|uniref:Cytidine deaminase n=1 Tax=Eeniella nana TaxID=13502 RepID=A0A875RZU1_EENNA|nr:uncharacterized protein FOA43_002391 [Brettanomyces nanus]QPG75051.1 hypothetical protein FOA43_002391 [Brettanomyces nanus]
MPPSIQPYTGKSPIANISDGQFKTLVEQAVDARKLSYSPYSHFAVGCAILTEDNQIVIGSNVENASYGAAICAERTAIVKAVTSGHLLFKALVVSTNSDSCSSPCGICRQVIREFSGPDLKLPIVMLDNKGEKLVVMSIEELLPVSFGPEDLVD